MEISVDGAVAELWLTLMPRERGVVTVERLGLVGRRFKISR